VKPKWTPSEADLRGTGRLAVDAVEGVTAIVEELHRNIAGIAPIVGSPRTGRTSGITGFVYRSIHGVTRAVGVGVDAALARLGPLLPKSDSSPRRETILAALNGVLGDYLHASGNPLAIEMQLRKGGRALRLDREALAADVPHAGARVLVLVHGLCMNDHSWLRDGHDHGAALARDLGYEAIYLHYNSGRHISVNGRELANLLEQLASAWPVRVTELVIVGHSMGGLVARSACHYAAQEELGWLRRLKSLVFVGTPHHGAPLERAGHGVDMLLGVSPYTLPFARLGKVRSAGIQDLRYGHVIDDDWQRRPREPRTQVPLPAGVRCLAIAASRQARAGQRPRGDGLVPVSSALGIPTRHRSIAYGTNHLDLLGSAIVYDRLSKWLRNGV